MYLCYLDESGTPDIPGNTSHYVLVGVSIPVECWKSCDDSVEKVKAKYGLLNEEIHIAWILRTYLEQNKIPDFALLHPTQRRQQVTALRTSDLLRLQRNKNPKLYRQTQKNYKKTELYTHLTYKERLNLVREIAQVVSSWGFARLFAECIDKVHFDPTRSRNAIDTQSFEQIVSRFEHYLQVTNQGIGVKKSGLLIHDNNETVAKKHTLLMKEFHKQGTFWTKLENIIETPLFVDSELTSMIQIADLCAYALRRYLENNETELFDLVFKRADRKDGNVVGVRHFTKRSCNCKICSVHRKI